MRGEIVDTKKRRKKQMCVFLKGKNQKHARQVLGKRKTK